MDIRVHDRTYAVDARRDGSGWLVSVNGRMSRVEAVAAGAGWSLLVGAAAQDARASRRSHDVAVERRSAGELVVHVDGHPVAVSLPVSGARAGRRTGPVPPAGGVQRIVAPMPGRVVKVLVEPGDVVADRQPVVVLEAMKMQNEVRATRGGQVGEVRAVAGTLVDAGAVLVVVAAPPAAGA